MGCTLTRLARSLLLSSALPIVGHWRRPLPASPRFLGEPESTRRLLQLTALVAGWFILLTSPAWAQRVVLVPPEAQDPVLSDAFNRLKAELAIHDFEIEVRGVSLGRSPTDTLTEVAQQSDAFAAIALLKREDQASVQIWLVDRVSGKVTMRALQVEKGSDTANLLAIRAVDLLRASLREFSPNEKPPTDVANVDRRATPVVVQRLADRPAPGFMLSADVLMLYQWPNLGMSIGPAIGGVFRLGKSTELDVTAAGPLLGAKYETVEGSASLHQEMFSLEPRYCFLHAKRIALGAGAVMGAMVLSAQGQPNAPLVSKSETLWGVLGGLGLHSRVELARGIAGEFAIRAFATTPRLGLRVDRQQTVIGLPMLSTSFGIRVAL